MYNIHGVAEMKKTLFACLCCALFASGLQAAEKNGGSWDTRLRAYAGRGLVRPAGTKRWVQARPGLPLRQGDLVRTGKRSSADLSLDGKGIISTESGVLMETQYSFSTRFENGIGTNPEELIAAAHAGCFSMAFSGKLTAAGFPPERIATTATVTLEKTDAGMTVTKIHLSARARVPGISPSAFVEQAESARATCPISRLLAPGAQITLNRRQHVRLGLGVRLPVTDARDRSPTAMTYLLWDWYEGGFGQGW